MFDYMAMLRSPGQYPAQTPGTERLIIHLMGGGIIFFEVPPEGQMITADGLRECLENPDGILTIQPANGDEYVLPARGIAGVIRQPVKDPAPCTE